MRGSGEPVAVTLKLAFWPAVTPVLAGCRVNTGATGCTCSAVTDKVAALEVTQPLIPAHTKTWNWAPSSASDVVAS